MGHLAQRLQELGMALPDPPKPVAAYVPAVITGNWIFTSGQLPMQNGQLMAQGQVGRDLDVETAYQAARQAALNALSAAAAAAGGLDRLGRVVKVVGFVQSADTFYGQPQVVNGASDLFETLFGEAGRHARSAVGTCALPLNACVEIECVFELAPHGA